MVARTVTCPHCKYEIKHPGPQYVDDPLTCVNCGVVNLLLADKLEATQVASSPPPIAVKTDSEAPKELKGTHVTNLPHNGNSVLAQVVISGGLVFMIGVIPTFFLVPTASDQAGNGWYGFISAILLVISVLIGMIWVEIRYKS